MLEQHRTPFHCWVKVFGPHGSCRIEWEARLQACSRLSVSKINPLFHLPSGSGLAGFSLFPFPPCLPYFILNSLPLYWGPSFTWDVLLGRISGGPGSASCLLYCGPLSSGCPDDTQGHLGQPSSPGWVHVHVFPSLDPAFASCCSFWGLLTFLCAQQCIMFFKKSFIHYLYLVLAEELFKVSSQRYHQGWKAAHFKKCSI